VWSDQSNGDHNTIICNQNLFQTQSILKKWTKKPKKIINTDSLELITRLVNEGIGFGIIPERAVLLSEFKLKKVNSLPTYKDNICLVYRPEFGKAPAEKLSVEALKMGILNN
jgi:DNA-binding transcriptional LysR family regulator